MTHFFFAGNISFTPRYMYTSLYKCIVDVMLDCGGLLWVKYCKKYNTSTIHRLLLIHTFACNNYSMYKCPGFDKRYCRIIHQKHFLTFWNICLVALNMLKYSNNILETCIFSPWGSQLFKRSAYIDKASICTCCREMIFATVNQDHTHGIYLVYC